MISRESALAVALAAIALVAAQIVFPTLDFFHTWQYALVLAILVWVLGVTAFDAFRAGGSGRAMGIAFLGALVVTVVGLASGLLGPDTARVIRVPGTVAPIPDIGAAAFFSGAEPATIARGDASVTVRRLRHSDVVVAPGARKFIGAAVLLLEPRTVAYLEAWDERGNHLTITQPTGTSFLSPILLFRDQQAIAGVPHPVDAFTLPGAQREIKAVYFTPAQAASLPGTPGPPGVGAVLFAIFSGNARAAPSIVVGRSGQTVASAGVRLRATLGRYPQLVVASAPQPEGLALGVLLFLGGLIATLVRRRPAAAPAENPARAPSGTTL